MHASQHQTIAPAAAAVRFTSLKDIPKAFDTMQSLLDKAHDLLRGGKAPETRSVPVHVDPMQSTVTSTAPKQTRNNSRTIAKPQNGTKSSIGKAPPAAGGQARGNSASDKRKDGTVGLKVPTATKPFASSSNGANVKVVLRFRSTKAKEAVPPVAGASNASLVKGSVDRQLVSVKPMGIVHRSESAVSSNVSLARQQLFASPSPAPPESSNRALPTSAGHHSMTIPYALTQSWAAKTHCKGFLNSVIGVSSSTAFHRTNSILSTNGSVTRGTLVRTNSQKKLALHSDPSASLTSSTLIDGSEALNVNSKASTNSTAALLKRIEDEMAKVAVVGAEGHALSRQNSLYHRTVSGGLGELSAPPLPPRSASTTSQQHKDAAGGFFDPTHPRKHSNAHAHEYAQDSIFERLASVGTAANPIVAKDDHKGFSHFHAAGTSGNAKEALPPFQRTTSTQSTSLSKLPITSSVAAPVIAEPSQAKWVGDLRRPPIGQGGGKPIEKSGIPKPKLPTVPEAPASSIWGRLYAIATRKHQQTLPKNILASTSTSTSTSHKPSTAPVVSTTSHMNTPQAAPLFPPSNTNPRVAAVPAVVHRLLAKQTAQQRELQLKRVQEENSEKARLQKEFEDITKRVSQFREKNARVAAATGAATHTDRALTPNAQRSTSNASANNSQSVVPATATFVGGTKYVAFSPAKATDSNPPLDGSSASFHFRKEKRSSAYSLVTVNTQGSDADGSDVDDSRRGEMDELRSMDASDQAKHNHSNHHGSLPRGLQKVNSPTESTDVAVERKASRKNTGHIPHSRTSSYISASQQPSLSLNSTAVFTASAGGFAGKLQSDPSQFHPQHSQIPMHFFDHAHDDSSGHEDGDAHAQQPLVVRADAPLTNPPSVVSSAHGVSQSPLTSETVESSWRPPIVSPLDFSKLRRKQ